MNMVLETDQQQQLERQHEILEEIDPRESMRALPTLLQGPLTALTGKPLSGQSSWNLSPMVHLLAALASITTGVAIGFLGAGLRGGWFLLLLPGWMLTLHGMRNLRMMMFHQCAHGNMFGRERVDRVLGKAISSLLLVEGFQQYRNDHIREHHSQRHMTMRDPTVRALLITLGLRAGMSTRQLWRRTLVKLVSPRFHLGYLGARIRSHFRSASPLHRVATLTWLGLCAATISATGTAVQALLAWVLPLTLFFQVSATLRTSVKHVFPLPGGPRRGKAYFASLTYGIFLGEPAPSSSLAGGARARAWIRWTARMLFVHFPSRYLVLTGDTVCHDFHHRYPKAKNWANYIFARQADVDRGHPGWPPYQEVWTLRGAMDLVFTSLSLADPQEFAVASVHGRAADFFDAFDD